MNATLPGETYQLALRTPGIIPSNASFRKQTRQIRNLRYTARERPHNAQRRTTRDANFGGFFDFSIQAFVAISQSVIPSCETAYPFWSTAHALAYRSWPS
jgi:hypothetical protein